MRNSLVLLFVVLLLSLTSALDCQYQITQPFEKQVQVLYSTQDNQILNPQITYGDFQSVGFGNLEKTFKIFNESDFDITVKVFLHYYYDYPKPLSPNEQVGEFNEIIQIGAHDYNTVYVGRVFTSNGFTNPLDVKWIDQESIKITYIDNEFYNAKFETKTFEEQLCKICGDKNCLNDGQQCIYKNECGGGYCVQGICNNSDTCYGLNCNCLSNQVQCFNQTCADKNSVEIGNKPTCNKAECKTNYIDEKSGLCEKSPGVIAEEKEQDQKGFISSIFSTITFVTIAIVVILIAGIFFILKSKELDIKQLMAKIEKENKQLVNAKKELKELNELRKEKNLTKEKLEQINKEIKQKQLEISRGIETLNESVKLASIPRLNKQGFKVIINENGYQQFPISLNDPSQRGELFHRWYAKKNIYEKNRKQFPLEWKYYEVDHIDQNKSNNDLSNLQILTKSEHAKKHRIFTNLQK